MGRLLSEPLPGNITASTTINWRQSDGKVASYVRLDYTIEFTYDAFGRRIKKTKKPAATITDAGTWTQTYYAYDANGQLMGIYDLDQVNNHGTPNYTAATLTEQHIYGASRIGLIEQSTTFFGDAGLVAPPDFAFNHVVGEHRYEITNHLGNVNAVITDNKGWNSTNSYYEAEIVTKIDYYPFGMEMPGRKTVTDDYRFAYNGMELDNEVRGDGNSYTTEFRQYDPRLGRWLSVDPLMNQFPWMSPYVAFNDNPVLFVDPFGLAAKGGPPEEAGTEYGQVKENEGQSYIWLGDHWETGSEGGGVTANRSKSSAEYKQWYLQNGGQELYNSVRDLIYQGKMNTGEKLGRLAYGSDFAGRVNYPQELKDKWMREANREAIYVLHGMYAAEKSGINPDKLGGFLLSLLPGFGTKYDLWLYDAASSTEEEVKIAAGIVVEVVAQAVPLLRAAGGLKTLVKAARVARAARRAAAAEAALSSTESILANGACFTSGTVVHTARGKVDIEKIHVGDEVWAYDINKGRIHLKKVYEVFEREVSSLVILFIEQDTIYTTLNHPFYVRGSWVQAQNLNVGDTLFAKDKFLITLKDKKTVDTLTKVYNFSVSEYSNYYVGDRGILVHNNCDVISEAVEAVFSDTKRASHLIHGSKKSVHRWGSLVTNLDEKTIRGVVEDVLRTGETVPYKSGSAKVKSVTINGVTKQVMVPFSTNPSSGKLFISSAWVVGP